MNAAQLRMARAALRWSLVETAERSGLHRNSIYNFENDRSSGDFKAVRVLRTLFEAAGVTFLDDDGQGSGIRLQENLVAEEENPHFSSSLIVKGDR